MLFKKVGNRDKCYILALLSRKAQAFNTANAENGERVKITFEGGIVASGYVCYDRESGGFCLLHRKDTPCKITQFDPMTIVSMRQANRSLGGCEYSDYDRIERKDEFQGTMVSVYSYKTSYEIAA